MTATLVDTFTAALAARGGSVRHVADEAAARAVLTELCDGPAVVDDDPLLATVCDGLERIEDPWVASVGVTTAVAAAAATGTLALAFDATHRRRTALVPPVHVAVVPVERMVATYAEALEALHGLRPVPSGMRMVSGPSSSGDIEMVLVRGMHGPVAVHVVLVGGA
jgi:L-lactate utilization protein LutC